MIDSNTWIVEKLCFYVLGNFCIFQSILKCEKITTDFLSHTFWLEHATVNHFQNIQCSLVVFSHQFFYYLGLLFYELYFAMLILI